MLKYLSIILALSALTGCDDPKKLPIVDDSGTIACPTDFVVVPGNKFCVSKFLAKDGSGFPVVSVTAAQAASACGAMSESGFNGTFALISNSEWMTIAHDLEKVSSNWSSGTVGSGHLVRGHSDNSPANTLAVTDETDSYNGTGNSSADAAGSGWEQRRTFNLSNGKKIWDFAGNASSWVDWSKSDAGFTLGPVDAANSTMEINVLDGSVTAEDLQSSGGYTSTESFGQWKGGTGGAAVRGGDYSSTTFAGAFSLSLAADGNTGTSKISYRCVYRP